MISGQDLIGGVLPDGAYAKCQFLLGDFRREKRYHYPYVFLRSIPVTFKTGKIVHSLTDTFYIHFGLILRYLWVDTFKVFKSKSCD